MTDKETEEIEQALNDLLVPWDWEDVVLPDFKEEYFDWCKNIGLVFGKDFYMHIDEFTPKKGSKWPFPEYVKPHHYLFKDPANATAFRLTFDL